MKPFSEQELKALREGGRRHALILKALEALVRPGVSTATLNGEAEKMIRAEGDIPSFLNYRPGGARRPYPASLCVSVNDAAVHGVPNEKPIILQSGDIVKLDLGITHQGMITDAAITVPVGTVDTQGMKLIRATEEALYAGLREARAGNHVGDVSRAIQIVIENAGFKILKELAGHGVGRTLHEDPIIPNYGQAGTGPELTVGMVLAIEPIVSESCERVVLAEDGHTWKTKDGSRATQFEHTVLITDGEPEILTKA